MELMKYQMLCYSMLFADFSFVMSKFQTVGVATEIDPDPIFVINLGV